jgi:predicted transcriptional regulator
MSASSPPPTAAPRVTARERELRRVRILARVQAGWSYEAIGREEGISRERVRQIVAESLKSGERETKLDHALVQIARLEPALRLAAESVAQGELGVIDKLLRVLDRLDKYNAVEAAAPSYDEGARERLLTKLNTMAERMLRARENPPAALRERGEDEAEPKNDETGFEAP